MQHLRDILVLPVCAETKHSTFRAIVVAIMIQFGIQTIVEIWAYYFKDV
jgi:hypothetical protein